VAKGKTPVNNVVKSDKLVKTSSTIKKTGRFLGEDLMV
jgi:hypothetical protein